MWRNTQPLSWDAMHDFEKAFHFRIDATMKEFLMANNAGYPTPGLFPTTTKERKLKRLLNFADTESEQEAWKINLRVREKIGEKRIVFAVDDNGNFLCLEREYMHQRIIVWSHITGTFEDCLLETPAFIRAIG